MNNNSPMDYHGALGVLRTIVKERPDAILVNEGANTLDLARGIVDMYQPRKRIDVGTWGVMGIGMGYALRPRSKPASRCSPSRVTARSVSPAWRSRPSAATICRSASSSSTMTASIAAPTSIRGRLRRGADRVRQGLALRQDDGSFRRRRRQRDVPDELKRAVNAAMDSGKPTLINAVLDPAAGSESGRIGNLNPQSKLKKK